MPLIDLSLIKGAWSLDQKQDMIRSLTKALADVCGPQVGSQTWVRVLEVEDGQWGIAGEPFTAADVERLRQSTPSP